MIERPCHASMHAIMCRRSLSKIASTRRNEHKFAYVSFFLWHVATFLPMASSNVFTISNTHAACSFMLTALTFRLFNNQYFRGNVVLLVFSAYVCGQCVPADEQRQLPYIHTHTHAHALAHTCRYMLTHVNVC